MIIQRFIEAGLVVDLPEAWRPADKDQQVTFSKFANMKEGIAGPSTPRIDTVLANRVAASAVLAVEFLFELGTDYDHLPISVALDIDAFSEMKKILPKHRHFNYQNIKAHKWTASQRHDSLAPAQTHCSRCYIIQPGTHQWTRSPTAQQLQLRPRVERYTDGTESPGKRARSEPTPTNG